jgi:hypothetical protein
MANNINNPLLIFLFQVGNIGKQRTFSASEFAIGKFSTAADGKLRYIAKELING